MTALILLITDNRCCCSTQTEKKYAGYFLETSSFEDGATGRLYVRGQCRFHEAMDRLEGRYDYSLLLVPGPLDGPLTPRKLPATSVVLGQLCPL